MTASPTASPAASPPTSLDALLERSGEAALSLSGAGQSAWNGKVVETTGTVFGLAHWDGTLYLDRDYILDPLRSMCERAGEDRPLPTLVRYREALATLLHEHAHFLGPAGATQEAARGAFTQPGSRQLEEGVTEAWTQDHLNEYLTQLGLDKVAPGIEDVRATGYYAAFVPAVRMLATDLESRTTLSSGEVLRTLNRQTAEGQFPRLVTLYYNSTRLPELDTTRRAAEHRHHLENILRDGLTQLAPLELLPAGFGAARSHTITATTLDHLHSAIHTAESLYTPHRTACALPAPTPARLITHPLTTALSGVAPPSRSTHSPAVSGPTSVRPPPNISGASTATRRPRRTNRPTLDDRPQPHPRSWDECSGLGS